MRVNSKSFSERLSPCSGGSQVLCLSGKLKTSFSERLSPRLGRSQVFCLIGKLDFSCPDLHAGKSEDSGVQCAVSWATVHMLQHLTLQDMALKQCLEMQKLLYRPSGLSDLYKLQLTCLISRIFLVLF